MWKAIEQNNTGGMGKIFTPNWGIIIPHTRGKKGARRITKSGVVNEYDYGILEAKASEFAYETRDDKGVKGAALNLFMKGCNASLEPHKNAFNTKVSGFQILVIEDDTLSYFHALRLSKAFAEKYPHRRVRYENGVLELKKQDRGYNNLSAAKDHGMVVALLTEMFFIDNLADWMEPEEMGTFWRENLSS